MLKQSETTFFACEPRMKLQAKQHYYKNAAELCYSVVKILSGFLSEKNKPLTAFHACAQGTLAFKKDQLPLWPMHLYKKIVIISDFTGRGARTRKNTARILNLKLICKAGIWGKKRCLFLL